MLFSSLTDSLPSNIIFYGTPLEEVTNIKFLGITVDNKLSWKSHIDNVCKIVSRNCGVLNKLKSHIPTNILFMLYSSLILPYLTYGILIWGNTYQTSLDRLLLLQKKCIRILCNCGMYSHCDPLFIENKILKIRELYLFQIGQFMFNYSHNNLPQVFDSMFPKNFSLHKYPTRQSNEYHLPLLRTVKAKSTFIFSGPKFWNSLPDDIKTAPSISSFKYKLKEFLLKSYTVPQNF